MVWDLDWGWGRVLQMRIGGLVKCWRLLFPQLAANVAEFHAKLEPGSLRNWTREARLLHFNRKYWENPTETKYICCKYFLLFRRVNNNSLDIVNFSLLTDFVLTSTKSLWIKSLQESLWAINEFMVPPIANQLNEFPTRNININPIKFGNWRWEKVAEGNQENIFNAKLNYKFA